MNTVELMHSLAKPNPDWVQLPLFDRSKWKTVKFGDVVRCLKEQVDPESGEVERYIAGEHMDTADVHIRRWGTVGDGYLGPAFIRRFRKGQVLYGSRRTYLKKVALADFDGVTANTTLVLEAKEGLLQELLPWIMLSKKFTEHSVRESKGSVNPYINWSDLAWFEFALPPLDQQRRIAELLWAVDEVGEGYRQLQDQLAATKSAQWHCHVAGVKSTETTVGAVASVFTGSTPSRKEDRFWTDGTIPWLPTGKVHDRFVRSADEFVTEEAVAKKKARVFPKGSVLVAMIGQGKTRGASAMLEIDASINQNFACAVPNGIDPYYLFYALDFSYEALRRSSHGSNQEALTRKLVQDFPIPCPNTPLQKELAQAMLDFDAALKDLHAATQARHDMLMALINALPL